ncbi:GPP34 family phosphoprotein, partial [Streptomyces sp. SID14478]|uniref:GPP34 family phosphoprotein n=1 Tax=Streptomyces sp. SID14478 TaxID=2706073 RepID=UPI0013DA38D6|nr:GPP34 family phosphoprotein [Streptomyces sp. SID14478]
MPHGSLSLPARLLLLAYDTGKDRVAGAPDLRLAVRAAALAALADRDLIHEVNGTVTPVPGARADDPVLDQLLEIIEESRPRKWRGWITHSARATHALVRHGLVADGYLRPERRRFLGLLPGTHYALERSGYVEVLRAEVLGAVTRATPPDAVARDDATLAVLAAAGHLRALIPARE